MSLLRITISPRSEGDAARLRHGLDAITAEDPTITVAPDALRGRVTIAGLHDRHLELIIDRLKRQFHVEAHVDRPAVVYKAALTRPAAAEMRYARDRDGRGHYGHVKIHVYPGQPGRGCVFENRLSLDTIPGAFIDAVEEGVRDSARCGVLGGYPVDDVRVELYDGSFHDIDSTADAFRIAAAIAFRDAASSAGPVLLEPVIRVRVILPDEYATAVVGNLVERSGQIERQQSRDGIGAITAHVPVAQMFGFAVDLHSRTMGRGTFSAEFAAYRTVDPSNREDDGCPSMARAPRPPTPGPRPSAIELSEPEPDDDDVARA